MMIQEHTVEKLSQEESERFRRWLHVAKRRLGVTFRLVKAGTGVARNSLLWYANQPGKRVPVDVARRVHGFFELVQECVQKGGLR